MGSTVKGLLRHGFEMSEIKAVEYDYTRYSRKLKLRWLNTINDKDYVIIKNGKKKGISKFPTGKFTPKNYKIISGIFIDDGLRNSINNKVGEHVFRNTIFSDCKLTQGETTIEKVSNWNRDTKKFGTPQYYETAEIGSVFNGKISCKYYSKEKSNMTAFSLDFNGETQIEIAFASLKSYYSRVIDLEENNYKIERHSEELKDFYNMLRNENSKDNQIVCKLGYCGAISKTLLSFNNTFKYNLLPYTLKYNMKTKLPLGWVKITFQGGTNEN
jgi:hypothetical protein